MKRNGPKWRTLEMYLKGNKNKKEEHMDQAGAGWMETVSEHSSDETEVQGGMCGACKAHEGARQS